MSDKENVSTLGATDMQFASLEAPGGPLEAQRRYNNFRWAVTLGYLVMALVVSVLPLFVDADETLLTVVIFAVTVGGAVVLIVVLALPYFTGARGPVVKDGTVLESGVVRALRPGETFRDVVRFDLVLYIVVPLIVVFGAVTVLFPEPLFTAIMIGTDALMVVLVVVFMNLEVRCDTEALSFHYGPVGKDIPLGDIESIRSVSVHPMRDFMGYGIRVGPDGAVGYIASGNVGVRVSLSDSKEYVVTVHDPQSLVDYVRAAKAEV
jgi:hypothetical protein